MKSEKQKMLDGELYFAGDPVLVAERIAARRLLVQLNTMVLDDDDNYREVLSALLPNCSDTVNVQPPFYCDYGTNITCGENTFFNFDCVVLDVAPVKIGRNGFFAPKVQLLTAHHPLNHAERCSMAEQGSPITIGDDCWLGGGVIVCPGVEIGDRCVIGAGAVVTRDIPSDSVAVGNPARVIRKLL